MPIQTFYEGRLFDPLGMRSGLKPLEGVPTYGLSASVCDLSDVQLLDRELLFRVDRERSNAPIELFAYHG